MGVGIFSVQKYNEASQKAINFIKNQMRMSPAQPNGHIPVSYLTTNHFMVNRCYIYDTGLALLVFATNGEYSYCQSIMNRLIGLQNTAAGNRNGSFDFSYDFYTGKIPNEIAIRTGAVGWLVWGMCYYMLTSGNRTTSYMNMINNAGSWLLGRQYSVPDPRAGLLKGGFTAAGVELTWCSTEHQCSALQALQGLALLTGNSVYSTAANAVIEWLKPNLSNQNKSLYRENVVNNTTYKRYLQGYNDDKWALDCATWAGATAMQLLPNNGISPDRQTIATGCRITAKSIYHFSSLNPLVEGFNPYFDPPGSYYENSLNPAPSLVWSEGTLGYVHLCMLLNEVDEARKYMDETIKLQNNSTGGILYVTVDCPDEPWEMRTWESICPSAWLYLLINNLDVLFPNLTPPPTNTINVNIVGSNQVYPKTNEKYSATLTPAQSNFGYCDWYLDGNYLGRDYGNIGFTIVPSGILTTYTEHIISAVAYTNTGDGINHAFKTIKIYATSFTLFHTFII